MPKQLAPGVVREIHKRDRQGESVSQIAQALGVDRRAVQAAIRRALQQSQQEHASTLVLADLLRRHYRLILRTALALRDEVASISEAPFRGLGNPRDAESVLMDLVAVRLGEALRETVASNLGVSAEAGLQVSGLCGSLVSALRAHEPALLRRLTRWLRVREQMQREGARIWQEMSRIRDQREWDYPEVDEPEVLARVMEGRPNDADAYETEPAQELLMQLDIRLRDSSLRSTAAQLREASHTFGEGVDAMVLRGRPLGHCTQCPVDLVSDELPNLGELDAMVDDGEGLEAIGLDTQMV